MEETKLLELFRRIRNDLCDQSGHIREWNEYEWIDLCEDYGIELSDKTEYPMEDIEKFALGEKDE